MLMFPAKRYCKFEQSHCLQTRTKKGNVDLQRRAQARRRRRFRTGKKLLFHHSPNVRFVRDSTSLFYMLNYLQLFSKWFKHCFVLGSPFCDMCEITLVTVILSVFAVTCLFVTGLSFFHVGIYKYNEAESPEVTFLAGFRQFLQVSLTTSLSYIAFPWKTFPENGDDGINVISPEEIVRLPAPAADVIVLSPDTETPVAEDRDDSDDSEGWWLQSPNGNHFRRVKAHGRQMSPCLA